MNKIELTEKEKKYLDYWITCKIERPTKALLIIAWFAVIMVLLLFFIICSANPEIGKSVHLAVLGISLCFVLILICLTKPIINRIKSYRTCEYETCRTKILSKEVYRSKNAKQPFVRYYYYRCVGIEGYVAPISRRLYDIAKVGDDITVVKSGTQNICLGITFGDESK